MYPAAHSANPVRTVTYFSHLPSPAFQGTSPFSLLPLFKVPLPSPASSLDYFLPELQRPFRHRIITQQLHHSRPPSLGQRPAHFGVGEAAQRPRRRGGIGGGDDRTGVADRFGGGHDAGPYHRDLVRHRLGDHVGGLLDPPRERARRLHQHVQLGPHPGQLLGRQRAGPAYPRREPQLARDPLQPLAIGPVSHHPQVPARAAILGERPQQGIESLFRNQASHVPDREPLVQRVIQRGRHVHAQLAQHRDGEIGHRAAQQGRRPRAPRDRPLEPPQRAAPPRPREPRQRDLHVLQREQHHRD